MTIKNLIVLEGIDGSGTTTQLRAIPGFFTELGRACVATAEPTDRPEGRLLRRILKGEIEASAGTVAFLFAADRHEHLYGAGGILEQTSLGAIVICDRYALSSLAYQGLTCGRELPALLNSRFPRPGLTLFFDVDAQIAMSRVSGRDSLEIYERLQFQTEVAAAYRREIELARAAGWNIVRIDAGQSLDSVTAQVRESLLTYIGG